eukprot:5133143-Prymnesium_polylepis.1
MAPSVSMRSLASTKRTTPLGSSACHSSVASSTAATPSASSTSHEAAPSTASVGTTSVGTLLLLAPSQAPSRVASSSARSPTVASVAAVMDVSGLWRTSRPRMSSSFTQKSEASVLSTPPMPPASGDTYSNIPTSLSSVPGRRFILVAVALRVGAALSCVVDGHAPPKLVGGHVDVLQYTVRDKHTLTRGFFWAPRPG